MPKGAVMDQDTNAEEKNEPIKIEVGSVEYTIRKLKSKDVLIVQGPGFNVRLSEADNRISSTVTPALGTPVTIKCK
jgi:hypothetical protein